MATSLDSEDLEYVYHHRKFYADLDLLHFGERSRDWPLGHAGDEGPHPRDDGQNT